MSLIIGMCILLGCQFLGEIISRALSLPVPGPVLGMLVLLIGLLIRGSVPASLRTMGEGLLKYLTLLFVPAGVGLIQHFGLIRQEIWILIATLIASTSVTILVTSQILQRTARQRPAGKEEEA
ncbi:CidA/LrgA family protein [Salinicola acroporae]|uniref:Murein hydrolase regulator LrgA n=1 Tax=Salinicola acroporae TaxID=1541440 RepID=A0ABT6I6B2_9GAMM|nr:CidA/LrgA family protein [Salinicola acroporae]MDH4573243.1 murein hydrolase regulator LrgA [Salinicola acroporae]